MKKSSCSTSKSAMAPMAKKAAVKKAVKKAAKKMIK